MSQKILLAVGSALILSGCSFGVSSDTAKPPGGSIWKSSNGGKTFEVKSQIDAENRIAKADILSIAYHPRKPGSIYVGTVESGIFKTDDGGEQWEQVPFPPKKIYSFILDKNDPDKRMFASGVVGEWGKIFRTDDGGEQWDEVYTEPGQKTVITALAQHFRDTNIIFAGTSAGTIVKSLDSGTTWKNIGDKVDGTVADFVFDAEKALVTYLMIFGQKVYYSPDGGLTWLDWEKEKVKEIEALQQKATQVSGAANQAESKRLQEQAEQLRTRNQKNKMPPGIVSLASDPKRSGVLYAGTNAGFFRSSDYGKYWDEINIIESAKQFPIRSIAVNPMDSREIVFVAGKAFYKSQDAGETWFVTGLNVDRNASFISYDPFDPKYLLLGLRNFK